MKRSSSQSLIMLITGLCVALSLFARAGLGYAAQDILTAKERAWLVDHPVIRVAVSSNYAPVDFIDGQGRNAGLVADYFKRLEASLNIKFQYVVPTLAQRSSDNPADKQADIVAVFAKTTKREQYWLFSKPYLNFPIYLIVRDDGPKGLSLKDLSGQRLSVVSGYATHNYLEDNYPNIVLDVTDDTCTGLQQVMFGISAGMVSDLPVASWCLHSQALSHLKIASQTEFSYNLGLAVRKDWPIMLGILEKGLSTISNRERDSIYNRWLDGDAFKVSWLQKNRLWLIALGLLVLSIIMIKLFLWDKKLYLNLLENLEKKDASQAEGNSLDYANKKSVSWMMSLFFAGLVILLLFIAFTHLWHTQQDFYSLMLMVIAIIGLALMGGYRFSSLRRRQEIASLLSRLTKSAQAREIVDRQLSETKRKLKDYAESAVDWLWETDRHFNMLPVQHANQVIMLKNLLDLAKHCDNHTPAELLIKLEAKLSFSDFIVRNEADDQKITYVRLSGKPHFDQNNVFLGYRGVGVDISEMVESNHRASFLASHDELTGLPNRAFFRRQLEQAVIKAEHNDDEMALLFLDIDHFKIINDTQGYDAGDRLLTAAAQRIKTLIGPAGVLGRIGADEFLLLCERMTPATAQHLAKEIIQAFSQPFELNEQSVYVGISIGISMYPLDTTDTQVLMVNSGLAVHRAKQKGRNNFEFYTQQMNAVAQYRHETEQGLRHALHNGELYVAYQPQIDMNTRKIVGMEALVRWRHSQKGLMSTKEFITVAEQSILINVVGDWVIERVCEQIKAWQDKALHVPRVSINISRRQLLDQDLSLKLVQMTKQYGISPYQLCVEFTESALVEELEPVRQNITNIRDNGFAVSLDDFCMGHSSLVYLKRWAVNEIKIDRSFVENIVHSEESRQIVMAIVALSHALGLSLISEGVETEQQEEVLKACGCKYVQGYLYAKALTADELAKYWLSQQSTELS